MNTIFDELLNQEVIVTLIYKFKERGHLIEANSLYIVLLSDTGERSIIFTNFIMAIQRIEESTVKT